MKFLTNIRKRRHGVNVPTQERAGTGILGALLALLGIRAIFRHSPVGWVLAGVGALLGTRAASGRCPGYRALRGR
jgi:uncharacterized membrane protein